jgi:hypothetical protein
VTEEDNNKKVEKRILEHRPSEKDLLLIDPVLRKQIRQFFARLQKSIRKKTERKAKEIIFPLLKKDFQI